MSLGKLMYVLRCLHTERIYIVRLLLMYVSYITTDITCLKYGVKRRHRNCRVTDRVFLLKEHSVYHLNDGSEILESLNFLTLTSQHLTLQWFPSILAHLWLIFASYIIRMGSKCIGQRWKNYWKLLHITLNIWSIRFGFCSTNVCADSC